MTATTVRMQIIDALVAQLRTIDGTGDYTYDVSVEEMVSESLDTDEELQELPYNQAIRIIEGLERVENPEITSAMEDTFWVVNLDLFLKGNPGETAPSLRRRINQFLGDVNLAVGRNPTLTGLVVKAGKAAVEPPQYAFDQTGGKLTMSLLIRYHNVAGSTI